MLAWTKNFLLASIRKNRTYENESFLEGKYKGKERVHTPAGDFDCIKIYTESKAKFMLFSEKEYSMSWYAKGVGIVKEERYNKRGNYRRA